MSDKAHEAIKAFPEFITELRGETFIKVDKSILEKYVHLYFWAVAVYLEALEWETHWLQQSGSNYTNLYKKNCIMTVLGPLVNFLQFVALRQLLVTLQ